MVSFLLSLNFSFALKTLPNCCHLTILLANRASRKSIHTPEVDLRAIFHVKSQSVASFKKKLSLIFLLHFRSRTGNFFTEHMVHFTGGRHCHVLFVFAQFCAFQRNCSMSEGDFACFPKEAKKQRNQKEIQKNSCFL